MLDGESWRDVLMTVTPARLAEGLGTTTFTPPRAADDPEVEALAATFGHRDGIGVLHETIQYLTERSRDERTWLEALAASSVPTTLMGLHDTISPVRVATFVWHEYLTRAPGRSRLYFIPGANTISRKTAPSRSWTWSFTR